MTRPGFIVPIYEGLRMYSKDLALLKKNILVYPSGNYGPFLMVTRIFMIYGIVFKKDSISSIQNDNFVENF